METEMGKKGILAVSFGTSYEKTRKRTIDAIEAALSDAFPDRVLYRAWTSRRILKKLEETKGIHYDTIPEAMERMKRDHVTDLLVQPTHMLDGLENRTMIEEIQKYQDQFTCIRIGKPMLSDETDKEALTEAVIKIFPELNDQNMLALMGHGSPHITEGIYESLDEQFREKGYPNICVGTVEHEPGFDGILERASRQKPQKIFLAPLMIVAGDHAQNDMAGEDEDSWKSQLERKGFQTVCVLKGLGEYPQIREIFVRHAQQAEKL